MAESFRRPLLVLWVVALTAAACTSGDSSPADPEAVVTTATSTTTTTEAPTTSTTATSSPTTTTTAPPPACVVTAPSADLGLDPFYERFCEMLGVPIVASGLVPDEALVAAAEHIAGMIAHQEELIEAMRDNDLRVGIIAASQVTTDIPEHGDLYDQFPGTDWDRNTRGVGATTFIPVSTASEENLLCYEEDDYLGEDLFIQLFAHSIRNLGIAFVDPATDRAIETAYGQAIAAGLWEDTFAAVNSAQYWAEGVQGYFDANLEAEPTNGIHNFVNTRTELEDYDPTLFALIDAVFGESDWLPTCPN